MRISFFPRSRRHTNKANNSKHTAKLKYIGELLFQPVWNVFIIIPALDIRIPQFCNCTLFACILLNSWQICISQTAAWYFQPEKKVDHTSVLPFLCHCLSSSSCGKQNGNWGCVLAPCQCFKKQKIGIIKNTYIYIVVFGREKPQVVFPDGAVEMYACVCVTLSPNPGDRQKVLRVKYYIARPAHLDPPTATLHAGDLIAQTRTEEHELAAWRLARCFACCHFLRCLPVLLILAYIVPVIRC